MPSTNEERGPGWEPRPLCVICGLRNLRNLRPVLSAQSVCYLRNLRHLRPYSAEDSCVGFMALAMLLSAFSSVFREVAMFIRMWLSLPLP